MDRLNICDTLLKHNEIEPFLKRIITDGEKWVKYENIVRKRSWKKRDKRSQTTSEPGFSVHKVILCVRWDWKEIIHYELLSLGQTINSVLYCEQLEKLRQATEKKRPELINKKGVVLRYINARLQLALMTRQKLRAWLESFDASTV